MTESNPWNISDSDTSSSSSVEFVGVNKFVQVKEEKITNSSSSVEIVTPEAEEDNNRRGNREINFETYPTMKEFQKSPEVYLYKKKWFNSSGLTICGSSRNGQPCNRVVTGQTSCGMHKNRKELSEKEIMRLKMLKICTKRSEVPSIRSVKRKPVKKNVVTPPSSKSDIYKNTAIIIEGLNYLHGKNTCHPDLNPDHRYPPRPEGGQGGPNGRSRPGRGQGGPRKGFGNRPPKKEVFHLSDEELDSLDQELEDTNAAFIMPVEPKNMLTQEMMTDLPRFRTRIQALRSRLKNEPEMPYREKAQFVAEIRALDAKCAVMDDELYFRKTHPSKRVPKKPIFNNLHTIVCRILSTNSIECADTRKGTVDVRNVDILGLEVDGEKAGKLERMIIAFWTNSARYLPDGIQNGIIVRVTNVTRFLYQGRKSFSPTESTEYEINSDDVVSKYNDAFKMMLENEKQRKKESARRSSPSDIRKPAEKSTPAKPFAPGFLLPKKPASSKAFVVSNEWRKFHDAQTPLYEYVNFVDPENRVFINRTHSPIFFRLHAIPKKTRSIFWDAAKDYYHKNESTITQDRLAQIPLLGGVYLIKYPNKSKFVNVSNDGTYLHNPSHNFAKCFDLPALLSGKQINRFFRDSEGNKIIMRQYQLKGCTNFIISLYEEVEEASNNNEDTSKTSRNHISKGEEFFVIHAHARYGVSHEKVHVDYDPSNVPRTNPVIRTEAERRSETMPVKKAVMQVKQSALIRGPADTKLTSSSLQANRSRRSRRNDPVRRVLEMQKNPKGMNFVQKVDPNHKQGGLQVFCSSRLIWPLYYALSVFFPERCKVSFADTSFKAGKSLLTSLLLRFGCFVPPQHIEGFFQIHQHTDTYSFDWAASMLMEFIEETVGTLDAFPDVLLRDSDDAFINGFLGRVRTVLDEKGVQKLVNDIDCLFHIINLNICYKATQLGIAENIISRLKFLCYRFFCVKTVEEFDEQLPVFLESVRDEIGNKGFVEYLVKNKIPQVRNRILKLCLASEQLKQAVSSFPKYNHPIEGSHTHNLRNNGIGVNSEIDEVIEKVGGRYTTRVFEMIKCILGLPSELKLANEVEEKMKGNDNFQSFRRNVLAMYLNSGTLEDQRMLTLEFSQRLPGQLKEHGFNEPEVESYVFNMNEESWVIKKLPIDIRDFGVNFPYGVEEAEKEILMYLNNKFSVRPINPTKSALYSKSFRDHLEVIVKSNYLYCDICKITEACQHSFVHSIYIQNTDDLRKAIQTPPDFRSIFPELNIRRGEKKNFRKKSFIKDQKKVVKEFPLVSNVKKIFVGYGNRDGKVENPILLFQSAKHKGRVVLSNENMAYYRSKKDLVSLGKSVGVKGMSSMKVDELRSEVFKSLREFAKEKCVFCSDGVSGYCCDDPGCKAKSVILMAKGNNVDTSVVAKISYALDNTMGDENVIEVFEENREEMNGIVSCFGRAGELINNLEFDKRVFKLLQSRDNIRAIVMEERLVTSLVLRLNLKFDVNTPGDGNCLFWLTSQQCRFYGIIISHLDIRIGCCDALEENATLVYGSGVRSTLQDDFGGREEYMRKVEQFRNVGVYGNEMCIVGICLFLKSSFRVAHPDPNFQNPWIRHSCQNYGLDQRIVNGMPLEICGLYYCVREHYQSVVGKETDVKTGLEDLERALDEKNRAMFDIEKSLRFLLVHDQKIIHKDLKHCRSEEINIGEYSPSGIRKKRRLNDSSVVCDEQDEEKGNNFCPSCELPLKDCESVVCGGCGKFLHKSKPSSTTYRCWKLVEEKKLCDECRNGKNKRKRKRRSRK